jgi:hypothetical protein
MYGLDSWLPRVDERKFPFITVFYPINEEVMIKLEYHYFLVPDGSGDDH